MSDKLCDVCKKNQSHTRIITQALNDWHALDERVVCDDCIPPTTEEWNQLVDEHTKLTELVEELRALRDKPLSMCQHESSMEVATTERGTVRWCHYCGGLYDEKTQSWKLTQHAAMEIAAALPGALARGEVSTEKKGDPT